MKKRLVVFSLVYLVAALVCRGQDNPYKEVSIASPTAAALGKFTDIPVSMHTGMPQVSIPLVTIKDGPIELPVSLSYHAGGVKVGEPAGWTGMGWALNAGGVITRSVRGAPDERGTSDVSNQETGYYSDYGFASSLMVYSPPYYLEDWPKFQMGQKDSEPDLFFFNFNGYSGKFVFRDDRQPVFFPQQDIKIEATYTGIGSIQAFTLTTPDGMKYYFGATPATGDVDPVEITKISNAAIGLGMGTVISSWFLNKIESADKKFTVTLNYAAESYGYLLVSAVTLPDYPSAGGLAQAARTIDYDLVKNLVSGVRLQSITFSNGSVKFVAGAARQDLSGTSYNLMDDTNTQAKMLDSVKLLNSQNEIVKQFKLYYNYFTDNSTPLRGYFNSWGFTSDKKRLRLDSIREFSVNGAVGLPATRFEYHTELLPRRLSFAQDHWGFSNGKTTNDKLLSTFTENNFTTIPGADREPSWPAMRAGALKKITYPTGGYTDFELEANTVWVSYANWESTHKGSITTGYDGSNPGTKKIDVTLNAGFHHISLQASPGTSQATLLLRLKSTGASVGGLVLPANTSAVTDTSKVVTVSTAGVYELFVIRDTYASGVGATSTVSAWDNVPVTANKIVGGLRAKTVTQYDGGGSPAIIKRYDYNYNGKSTGVLYGRPTYVQIPRNDVIRDQGGYWKFNGELVYCSWGGCTTCDADPGYKLQYVKSGGSVRPMDATQGNHIGYNEVKVSQDNNGYAVYRYYGSDLWDMQYTDIAVKNVINTVCDPTSPNYPAAPLPFEYKRGELKTELYFNNAGNLLKQVDHLPTYEDVPGLKVPAYVFAIIGFNPGVISHTYYELVSKYKKQEVTITMEAVPGMGNTYTYDTVFYNSPYHSQATRSVHIGSNNARLETRTSYAFDLRYASCDAINDCTTAYTNACNSCNATYVADRTACEGDGYCLFNVNSYWKNCLTNARAALINCRKDYFDPAKTSSYPYCMTGAAGSATGDLKPVFTMRNMFINPPVELSEWTNGKLTKSLYSQYEIKASPEVVVYPTAQYALYPATLATTFAPVAVSGNTLAKDSRYAFEADINITAGAVQEFVPVGGVGNAYLWDVTRNYPVAKAVNTTASGIAYTSFESSDYGNWDAYSGTITSSAAAPTGGKYFTLVNGSPTARLSKTVTNGSKYIISYWRNSATPFTITGGTATVKSGPTIAGWTFHEHRVTASSTSVAITGAGAIDEVRLYPLGAAMTTYTYTPLVGMSSESDPTGRITYYEYDEFGRLSLMRDQNRNVIKKYSYNYYGQPEDGAFMNEAQTGNFTRNNCAAGGTGSTVSYTVVAGRFTSMVSQADANAQAVAALNTEGQAYANANGTCTPTGGCGTCSGNDRKCINNVCETGVQTCISSVYQKVTIGGTQVWKWVRTYRYCFSDGSASTYSWTEYYDTAGTVGGCATEID